MSKKKSKIAGNKIAAAGVTSPPEHPSAVHAGQRSTVVDFETWMRKAGITWDTSYIQLRAGSGDADGSSARGGAREPGAAAPGADAPWAVHAVVNVPEGQVLATIPRCAVLSAANSGLADVLAAERLGGGLALVAAVMYEAARGPRSKWYGYLSSLPPREYLPVFWSEGELRQLEGTDLWDKTAADREAMAADFNGELAPLLERYPARLGPLKHGWNLQAFMRAASWVASRAFYVDEHHGDALVPLADVFNHKAARVDLQGRGGGWAAGFEVAEHADARRRQQRGRRGGGGGGGGRQQKRGRGSCDAGDGDHADSEGAGEGDEGSSSGPEDEDADSGSADEDTESGPDEDEEVEEDEGEEEEEVQEEAAQRPRKRGKSAVADLDRDPGDDGSDPWPPPPPPPPPSAPPPSQPVASVAAAAAAEQSAAAAPAAARPLADRWRQLGALAVTRGGQNLHLDIGICAGERGGCLLLDIVAAQPLAARAEVFNTYGEHGNCELVNKYGFALPYNPFDEVVLDKGALLSAAEAQLGPKEARKRARFLEKHSELLSEEEEPFLLLPPRHISTALYVTLAVLGAEPRQAAGWKSLEDVVAPLRAAWQLERQQRQQQQLELQQQQQQRQQQGEPGGAGQRQGGGAAEGEAGGGRGGTKRKGRAGARADTQRGKPAKRAKGGRAGCGAAAGAKAEGPEADQQQEEEEEEEEEHGEEAEAEDATAGIGGAGDDGSSSDDGSSGDDSDDDLGEGEEDEEDDLPEDVEIQGPDKAPKKSRSGSGSGCGAKAEKLANAKERKGEKRTATGQSVDDGNGAGTAEAAAAAAAPPPQSALWNDTMRSLLRRVVSERLAAYPTTLEQDEQELRNQQAAASGTADKEKRPRKSEERMRPGKKGGRGSVGGGAEAEAEVGAGGGSAAEAAAARSCALLLRLGEKRLLSDVLAHLS